MTEEQAILTKSIADITGAWAEKFFENRKTFLDRRKVKASGDLERSMGYDINTATGEVAVRAQLAFENHGRYIDLKRFQHDKWGRNAVERIEKWIEARGLQKFEPGYLKKYNLKKAPKDIKKRMAWGILVNRSNGRFRRKAWFAKSKTAAVSDLYNQVAAAMVDDAANIVKKRFDPKAYAAAKGR